MVCAVILGILFGGGCLACAGIAIWGAMDEGTVRKCVGGILCPILFVLFLCIPFSFHQIETGEVAVVKTMGKVSGTRDAGIHFDFWMTNKYEKYDTKTQGFDLTAITFSKDAQQMDLAVNIQYTVDVEKVAQITEQYGSLSTLDTKVQSVAEGAVKTSLSTYSAMEVIEKRADATSKVEVEVRKALKDKYFVDVKQVTLKNIDFSDAFEAQVELKMIAEQEKLQAEFEKEKAIINAERDLEVAKREAEAKLYAAEQDAEAKKTIADAEAYATTVKVAKLANQFGAAIKPIYKQVKEQAVNEDGTPKYELNDKGQPDNSKPVYVKNTDGTYKLVEDKTQIIGYDVTWPTDTDNKTKNLVVEYLKYLEYLATWNGELPNVVTNSNGSILVQPETGTTPETGTNNG